MKHAELCPVCKGSGETHYKERRLATCHGCNGRGWVEVGEDSLDPALVPYVMPELWKVPEPYPYYPYPWYPTVTWDYPETKYYVTCIN